jgi:hypothetical protein
MADSAAGGLTSQPQLTPTLTSVSEGWSFDSLRSLRTFDLKGPAMSEPSARESELKGSRMVSLNFASWNRVVPWLRAVDELRRAA